MRGVGEALAFLRQPEPPGGWRDMLAGRARAADHLAIGRDAGPQSPNGGKGGDKQDSFNLGIYRLQVTGSNTTLMRWLKHRGGAQHHARWKGAGKREPLPAAVVIGADPAPSSPP